MNDSPELGLLRELSLQTKALVLAAEARAGALPCERLAELLGLLASDQHERIALASAVLRDLAAERIPAGRIKDLCAAFGVSPLALAPAPAPTGGASGPAGGPPQPPPPPAPLPPARPAAKPAPASGATGPGGVEPPTVLVADDDPHLRMLFRAKLEAEGFLVIEAADGHEAWRQLQTSPVAVVILDMKMPGLHGLEILSRLAEGGGGRLPVVVCTAYGHLEDEFAVASYAALRFLTKPVDAEHLAETVINLLAESP